MSFNMKIKLPTPKEIIAQYPVPEEVAKHKAECDAELIDVFTGKSDKFLVIIGSCLADNEEAVCDYIGRLVKVQKKVSDKLILVPRIYTNKPENYRGWI